MKRIVSLSLLLTVALVAAAYNISGRVVDSADEPLISASVRLMTAADSTVVKGVVTNSDGKFNIQNVKNGKFVLEVSYIGYNNEFVNVAVSGASRRLEPIKLTESAIMLKETTVVGIKTPITVKEDTVEFNADSYRTTPNAVVEDLLKRLPGVEVDSSTGKITANGQEVTKILVDGKEFFSDDPTVASRNLPVEMVERLQVVNRKSDLSRLTGVDDGEDETVINLTVKKEMKNGWFGNVEMGYGTDDRYKGSFNINRFWNGNQITFIGGANNVNDLGFTDGTSGRFRRFGGQNGITSSQAFGVNFNVGKEEIFRVGGNVMYSRSDRDTEQTSNRQYLLEDMNSFTSTAKDSRDIGNNIRADFRVQWKPDSFNTVDFRPNFSYNHNHSWSDDWSKYDSGEGHNTLSDNSKTSRGDSWNFGGRLIYNHNFKRRRGRALSLFVNYKFSNTHEYADTWSLNKYFQYDSITSADAYDQYEDNRTWSNNISARVSWTEPIGDASKGNFLTFAYRFQYHWNNADKLTYDHPVAFPNGWAGDPVIDSSLILNDTLSNRFRNDYMNQNIRVGYKHVAAKHNIDVGVSVVPQRSKSIDLINSERNIPERWVWNFAPYLRYRWKASKTKALNLDYYGRSSQPSMAQLQPVTDMSDPLNIIVGNPNLDATFTHNIRLRFHNFNPEAQRSIMTMLNASIAQNSIVSKTTYDKTTGGRTTTYENVNGVWNLWGMNMVSFPFKNKTFTFNNHMMVRYSNSIGFNNGIRNRSSSLYVRESFGIAWRPDYIELELRPQYSIQTVHNTVQSAANNTVHTYGGAFNATYDSPFGLVLASDLRYSATSGYSAGYDDKKWTWNASISYEFLKDRSLTLSLKAYDLLRQNSNIRRTVNANYIEDVMTNTLGRYFMFTVAYKFNTFGKGNEPTNRNYPHGRMGPPPGAHRRRPI